MRNKTEIEAIVDDVQRRLNVKRDETGLALHVPDDGYVADDDWLTVIVRPERDGTRASLYVEILSEVEHDLRDAGVSDVVLVPAIVSD